MRWIFSFFLLAIQESLFKKLSFLSEDIWPKKKKIDNGEGYCASDTVLDLIHQFKTNSAYTTVLITCIKVPLLCILLEAMIRYKLPNAVLGWVCIILLAIGEQICLFMASRWGCAALWIDQKIGCPCPRLC